MTHTDITKFMAIIILLFTTVLTAQHNAVESKVYYWKSQDPDKNIHLNNRLILEGSTTKLEFLQIHAASVDPGKYVHLNYILDVNEILIIIKEGQLKFRVKEDEKILGPGSVALIYPGEKYKAENTGDTTAIFYIMQYRSKAADKIDRGLIAEESFMIAWDDLTFMPHDRGGIRQYFERATAMLERFEMHVTTLNGNIKSHEPHIHRTEEIVLMINGNAQLQIGESYYDASAGDLIFLDSDIPHALQSVGRDSCMYFAFQWE